MDKELQKISLQELLVGKTVSKNYLRIIENEFRRRGYDPQQVQQELKIEDVPQDALDCASFYHVNELWHKAERFADDPLFSMKAALNIHPADFGPLGLLCLHGETVGQAWTLAYKYQSLISNGFTSTLNLTEGGAINTINCLDTAPDWSRPYVEHDFVALITTLRFATANLNPELRFGFNFRHQPSMPVAIYQQVFDADYNFGMPLDQIIIPSEVFDLPIYSSDKEIFDFLLEKVDREYNARKRNEFLSRDLAAFIEDQLKAGKPISLEKCSTHFNISSSTLKRRLLENNTAYQDILNRTKLKLARQLLKDDNIRINQIAYRLGYSNLSQFTRFLKSKTGMSPSEHRQQLKVSS